MSEERMSQVRVEVLTGVGEAVYPPGASFGPRELVDRHELVLITAGDCEWRCGDEVVSVWPGTVLLNQEGLPHFYRWDPAHASAHLYFHFKVHLNAAKVPPPSSWPPAIHLPDGDIVRPLFRHLAWLLDHHPTGWEGLASCAARQLFLAYVTGSVRTRGDKGVLEFPEPVEAALRSFLEACREGALSTPTLSELARTAGVSPGHLCKLFKRSLGCGPMHTLRLLRLQRAALLLMRSNLRVNEIGTLTGYEDAFHFSHAFKSIYGLAPRAYRTRTRAGETIPPKAPSQALHVARRLT